MLDFILGLLGLGGSDKKRRTRRATGTARRRRAYGAATRFGSRYAGRYARKYASRAGSWVGRRVVSAYRHHRNRRPAQTHRFPKRWRY